MRIIKRKKGNKQYYYLQHSFRSDGKVITREKYIGVNVPKDIDLLKRKFHKEIQPEIFEQLNAIRINFQNEWGNLPKSIREQQKEELAITFTYNTNAIEGSTISEAEVRGILLDKVSPGKSLRDINETEGHNAVFLEMLEQKKPIFIPLLLRWHKDIFNRSKPEIAGEFRVYNVRVGSYVAPHHLEVNKLMNDLIRFIKNESDKLNPVELAAMVHYRFEKIHPFADGNGRIGRLIINYILWFSGYPIMIVEYKKRNAYYLALERDEDGFISYFIRTYISVNKKLY